MRLFQRLTVDKNQRAINSASVTARNIFKILLRNNMLFNNRSLLMFTLSVLLLSGCEQEQVQEPQKLRKVKILQVKPNTAGQVRTFSGLAKGQMEANLSFKLAGTISSLPVKVGDKLKKSQLIAQIDPLQFELQAQQSHATLAQAMASMRNAVATFERLKGLYENNNASKHELDAARASAEFSQAQVKAARKGLELAQLNLSYTRLKSSNECDVAEIFIENHENVGSGQSIAKVSCGKAMDIEIGVPAQYVASVKKDMLATIIFNALPDEKFTGVVSEVGVSSSSGGASFPVNVTLKNEKGFIRSGMSADVTVNFDMQFAQKNMVIPAFSVIEKNQQKFVFLLKNTDKENTGVIKQVLVTVGELTSNGLEILSGLTTGDKVIVAGVSMMRDELKVRTEP